MEASPSFQFFASQFIKGQLLKKKTLIPPEKFFPLRVDSFWEDSDFQVSKQEVTKSVFLRKHGGNNPKVSESI